MDTEWALVEYRRGRYVKVTSDGTVLGRATDDEIRAWFASHGWRFGRPRTPEPAQLPSAGEEFSTDVTPEASSRGTERDGLPISELGRSPAEQPSLPALERDGARLAAAKRGAEPKQEPTVGGATELSQAAQDTPAAPENLETEPVPDVPSFGSAAALEQQDDVQPTARRPVTVSTIPVTAQTSEQKALELELEPKPAPYTPAISPQDSATRKAREDSARRVTAREDGEASIRAAESRIDKATAGWTSVSVVKPAIVPLSAPDKVSPPVEAAQQDADTADRWLWVDPRQEPGYSPAGFDLAAFLDRAIDLFRSKPWTGEAAPRRLAVHPSAIAEPLETAADERELELVPDPRVAAGTYRLALAGREQVAD